MLVHNCWYTLLQCKLNKHFFVKIIKTRTAWAVFKYCGTITVTLRMTKKYEKIDLKFISKETNKIRGKN